MYACSLESPWDVQFGLHLCSTPVLGASLFDKLASNRIAAQLSANLMAPGQPQDLADHHVNPPTPPQSSSMPPPHFSSSAIQLYRSLSCKHPSHLPAFTLTSADLCQLALYLQRYLNFLSHPRQLFVFHSWNIKTHPNNAVFPPISLSLSLHP